MNELSRRGFFGAVAAVVGPKPEPVSMFSSWESLADALPNAKPGDVILLKPGHTEIAPPLQFRYQARMYSSEVPLHRDWAGVVLGPFKVE